MTSMKRIFAVVLMVLMLAAAAFAEGHKRQKIVVCMTNLDKLAKVTRDLKSGKAVIKEPKIPEGDIPEGWHVVQMHIDDSSAAVKYIYLVIEEN